METRKPYPTDVSDEEWAFVAPYLTLLPLDAQPRKYGLREVFNTACPFASGRLVARLRSAPTGSTPTAWPEVVGQRRRGQRNAPERE